MVPPMLAMRAALPVDTTRANPLRAIQDGNLAVHMSTTYGAKVAFDIHRFEDGECRALGQLATIAFSC